MQSPSQTKIDRICKLLGMLGSDYQGERDNAATKVSEMVKELGLTWNQLLKPKAAIQPIIHQGFTTEEYSRAVSMAQQRGYDQGYRDGLSTAKATQFSTGATQFSEPARDASNWRDRVKHMRDSHWDDLDEFQQKFCMSILRQRRSEPSDRQWPIIDRMEEKCECPWYR